MLYFFFCNLLFFICLCGKACQYHSEVWEQQYFQYLKCFRQCVTRSQKRTNLTALTTEFTLLKQGVHTISQARVLRHRAQCTIQYTVQYSTVTDIKQFDIRVGGVPLQWSLPPSYHTAGNPLHLVVSLQSAAESAKQNKNDPNMSHFSPSTASSNHTQLFFLNKGSSDHLQYSPLSAFILLFFFSNNLQYILFKT